MRTGETKRRILAIERMLTKHKRLTTPEILRRLEKEYDITAERKAIYDDIAVLTTFFPLTEERFGNKTYWILGNF